MKVNVINGKILHIDYGTASDNHDRYGDRLYGEVHFLDEDSGEVVVCKRLSVHRNLVEYCIFEGAQGTFIIGSNILCTWVGCLRVNGQEAYQPAVLKDKSKQCYIYAAALIIIGLPLTLAIIGWGLIFLGIVMAFSANHGNKIRDVARQHGFSLNEANQVKFRHI